MVDEQLMRVLGQHSALEGFKLSSCSRVTDVALASLPANTLRELILVSCGGIEGTSIHRLRKLEMAELSFCNAVTEHTIQVSAAAGVDACSLAWQSDALMKFMLNKTFAWLCRKCTRLHMQCDSHCLSL